MKGSLLLYDLKLNCLIFFYHSKQFTDYIYTDIYCKLSKCIGQTLCSYEHILLFRISDFFTVRSTKQAACKLILCSASLQVSNGFRLNFTAKWKLAQRPTSRILEAIRLGIRGSRVTKSGSKCRNFCGFGIACSCIKSGAFGR